MKRILFYILICSVTTVASAFTPDKKSSASAITRAANKSYKAQDYETAQKLYSEALELDSDNAIAKYNRANTYFKLGKTTEAINDYLETAAQGGSKKLASRSKYNLGSAYLKQTADSLKDVGGMNYNKQQLNEYLTQKPEQLKALLDNTKNAIQAMKDAKKLGLSQKQLLPKIEAARTLQKDLKEIQQNQPESQENQDQDKKDDQNDKSQDKDNKDSQEDQQGENQKKDESGSQNQNDPNGDKKNDQGDDQQQDQKQDENKQNQKDDSEQQSDQSKDEKDKKQEQNKSEAQKDQSKQKAQQSRADSAKADDIIEKENENKKKRVLIPGRYRKVEKDW